MSQIFTKCGSTFPDGAKFCPGPQSFGTPYGAPSYNAPQQPYNNMR